MKTIQIINSTLGETTMTKIQTLCFSLSIVLVTQFYFASNAMAQRKTRTKPIKGNLEKSIQKSSTTKVGSVKKNSIGMELVYIPPGEFMMGSTEREITNAVNILMSYCSKPCDRNPIELRNLYSNELPKHKVTIKEGFWMGKYEVTEEQWDKVMGHLPRGRFQNDFSKRGWQEGGRRYRIGQHFICTDVDCPATFVNWEEAKEFVRQMNVKNDDFEYSLPSEAQWEYAARAGTTTAFAFGSGLSSTQANFCGDFPFFPFKSVPEGECIGKPVTVGIYTPNAWGLYDMHGNVAEWCEDIYYKNYLGLPTDGSANISIGNPKERVIRGGDFDGNGASYGPVGINLRSAKRDGSDLDFGSAGYGFRVVARLK